jgi:hypothetical protein
MLRAQVSQDISAVLSSISYGFGQFDGFDQPGPEDILGKAVAMTNTLDTSTYEYTDGWHIAYVEQQSTTTMNDLTINYEATISDSVQFRNGDVIVQFPDENTDYLHFKFWLAMLLNMQVEDTSISMNINTYHTDCLFDVQPDQSVLVNGDMDLDYSIIADQGSEHAEGSVAYSLTVDDLQITAPEGCPVGGSISASLNINLEGPQGTATGDWTLSVTFLSNSQMHVILDSPRLHLDYTETFDCSGGFLASPVQAFIANH